MSIKHLVVFLMVNCGQDASCSTLPMPLEYMLNSTFPSTQMEFPINTCFENFIEEVDSIEAPCDAQVLYGDRRMIKGVYRNTINTIEPEDSDINELETEIKRKDLVDPGAVRCGSIPIYIIT